MEELLADGSLHPAMSYQCVYIKEMTNVLINETVCESMGREIGQQESDRFMDC